MILLSGRNVLDCAHENSNHNGYCDFVNFHIRRRQWRRSFQPECEHNNFSLKSALRQREVPSTIAERRVCSECVCSTREGKMHASLRKPKQSHQLTRHFHPLSSTNENIYCTPDQNGDLRTFVSQLLPEVSSSCMAREITLSRSSLITTPFVIAMTIFQRIRRYDLRKSIFFNQLYKTEDYRSSIYYNV